MSSRRLPDPNDLRWSLILGSVGVVFGDIATSPLYALKVAFSGKNGVSATPEHVMGILSLVFWSLIIVVGIKYALLIMRADNKGEGGIMALISRGLRVAGEHSRLRGVILTTGLAGAALFFGDAAITPAISVLSAVEGLKIAAPGLKSLILPASLLILIALFLIQRRGTAFISGLFSPVMLIWLLVLLMLGVNSIIKTPAVLEALNPLYGMDFLMESRLNSLIVLGAVGLTVTGAEALYANMGHFGMQPIRWAWFVIVFPALTLNYLGQGALLLRDPQAGSNPFYLLAPGWAVVPLMGLATLASIIASQAVVSGAFSLSAQAARLRFLPRLNVRHTSVGVSGQIYVPATNWVLAAVTAALVLGFGSSSRLAGAYGLAVTGTMVVTTFLGFGVLSRIWFKSLILGGLLLAFFSLIDLAFLAANAPKILQGGWVSLVIGGSLYLILSTWLKGRELLIRRLHDKALPLEELVSRLSRDPVPRVKGTAVYMTAGRFGAPLSLMQNLVINQVLHEQVVVMTVVTRDEPMVSLKDRIKIRHFGDQIYRVRIYYGYNQEPNIPEAMDFCGSMGLVFDPSDTTYFLSREHMISTPREGMAPWRERLFIRMAMNAENAMRFWRIPPDRVVELGLMVEL